jgi:hypothetical protein
MLRLGPVVNSTAHCQWQGVSRAAATATESLAELITYMQLAIFLRHYTGDIAIGSEGSMSVTHGTACLHSLLTSKPESKVGRRGAAKTWNQK